MNVILEYIEDVAPRIKTFWFRPEKPVRFVAGQFTEIRLPLDHPDERGAKHWFTISSSPTDELVGITTKFSGQGSAFKDKLANLRPGTKLTLADPMGDFVLPKDKRIPLLFVAGGIGITPMHSIVKWLHAMEEQRQIHLVHSVRAADELVFRDLFEAYPLTYRPIVTEPDSAWSGDTGMLTAERILELAGSNPKTLIYLAGPEPMVEQFVDELQVLGVPYHRLVTDYFPGYTKI